MYNLMTRARSSKAVQELLHGLALKPATRVCLSGWPWKTVAPIMARPETARIMGRTALAALSSTWTTTTLKSPSAPEPVRGIAVPAA